MKHELPTISRSKNEKGSHAILLRYGTQASNMKVSSEKRKYPCIPEKGYVYHPRIRPDIAHDDSPETYSKGRNFFRVNTNRDDPLLTICVTLTLRLRDLTYLHLTPLRHKHYYCKKRLFNDIRAQLAFEL